MWSSPVFPRCVCYIVSSCSGYHINCHCLTVVMLKSPLFCIIIATKPKGRNAKAPGHKTLIDSDWLQGH
jgi:hypothetical protein